MVNEGSFTYLVSSFYLRLLLRYAYLIANPKKCTIAITGKVNAVEIPITINRASQFTEDDNSLGLTTRITNSIIKADEAITGIINQPNKTLNRAFHKESK